MIALARCLVVASVAILAACDSSPDPSPNVVDPTRLTVLPATATLYSGLPTTFVLSGGTGSYIVTSSNQAAIPISGNVLTKSFVVIPSPVSVDTPVTLTVRDTGTAPLATAQLTVRPGTVSNSITITPTPNSNPGTNPDCRPAVCSGSDAEVSVVLSQGGVPLAARGVRVDVVRGDFRFVTSPAGLPEVLGLSVTTVSDETGRARARLRATALVQTQTATLRITDVGSGAFQEASFTIAQFTGNAAVFFATPPSVTFTGPRTGVCASGSNAQVTIYGGTPPYAISGSNSAFTVAPPLVVASGGSFTLFTALTPVCSTGSVFSIQDAAGRVITFTAENLPGTEDAPPFTVAPLQVTLATCTERANVVVAGGITNFPSAAAGSDILQTEVTGAGRVAIFRRRPSPMAVVGAAYSVGITDGESTAEVVVNLTGAAAAACP